MKTYFIFMSFLWLVFIDIDLTKIINLMEKLQ